MRIETWIGWGMVLLGFVLFGALAARADPVLPEGALPKGAPGLGTACCAQTPAVLRPATVG